jgi:hypothetical protein
MNTNFKQEVSSENLVRAFADALKSVSPQYAQKGTGASVGPYVHGPGGIFGVMGLERDVISTHTQITGSLGEVIPMGATNPPRDPNTNEIYPLFPYITGFLRSDQQEKNAVCDEPIQASPMKTCILTAQFGRKEFKTREMEVNRAGQVINAGEFSDLNLINSPLVNQMGGMMAGFLGLNNQAAALAGREFLMRMVEVGVAFQRWFCPIVYTGNPANNSAGGGYKEFPGLDLLIGTNKVDALAGTACPSLYSDVKSFSYRQVDSTTDPDIVRVLTTMMRILKSRARQQNMGAVDWRLVMRDELFYALTEIWPCRYITYRCSNIDGTGIDPVGSYSVEAMFRMKNEMRDGQYLLIDNVRYPVILDDCIAEDNRADNGTIPAGCFASDIYIVPFTILGGAYKSLYWENYNYSTDQLPSITGLPAYFWSDSGRFLWTILTPHVWCIDAAAKVEPRLILRTPQLAGRLTDVAYCPLQHTNDPLPSQDYFVNGGISTGRPYPSPYSEWNLNGPGGQR